MNQKEIISLIKESKDCINLVSEKGFNLYIRGLSNKANKIISKWVINDKISEEDISFLSDFTFKVTSYEFNKKLKELNENRKKEQDEEFKKDELKY